MNETDFKKIVKEIDEGIIVHVELRTDPVNNTPDCDMKEFTIDFLDGPFKNKRIKFFDDDLK